MPFTFSHPAIILPLIRLPQRYFSFTGLIVGTVVPDFEYFFRVNVFSRYSHNPGGLFYFDIPVGVLLCFVFHGLVKKDLIANSPAFFRMRSGPVLRLNWNESFRQHFPAIVLSILAGAASHLFWDGFTHYNGYFVKHLGYQSVSYPVFGIRIKLYSLLQHFSTLAGLLFLFLYLKRMPVRAWPGETRIHFGYWIFVILICAALSTLRLTNSETGPDEFGKIILTLISGFLIGLVLAPFFFRSRISPALMQTWQ